MKRWPIVWKSAGYAGGASLLLAWCWAERAAAQVEQASFDLGARLVLALGEVVSVPQAIAVNGQSLWVASKTTPLSVSEALDRFDAHCVSGARALSTDLAQLEAAKASTAPELPSLGQRALIRRAELPGRGGQLVCLAPNEPLSGFVELGERLGTLFATGELGALGELRYVQARPRAEGGSHVVSVWSAGAFNLFDALPRDTDVPGHDPERAPRPPEATRILSASIPGRSYAIASYVSRRSAAELAAYYASEMPKEGWALLDAERFVPETAALSPLARAYALGDAITFVVVDDTAEVAGSRATATLVQMGSPGAASAGGLRPRSGPPLDDTRL
jgi:hypothetical protein